ncbi:MAG: hypothetical protein QXQ81_10030 [Candidatus Thorarchaeota archaeon]
MVEALAESGYSELKTVGATLVLGRKKIQPIFKSGRERALANLCHGSLAYCCPLTKRCPERDRALEIIGITPHDYQRMKDESHRKFMDLAVHGWEEPIGNDIAAPGAFGPLAPEYAYRQDYTGRSLGTIGQVVGPSDRPITGDERVQSGRTPTTGRGPFREDLSNAPDGRDRETVVEQNPARAHDRHRAPTCSGMCDVRSEAATEGLGALFRLGELSPFRDDGRGSAERTTFCLSCGRTIRVGISRCPFCGALQ